MFNIKVRVRINNRNEEATTFFSYQTQDTCPICKSKIEPIFIAGCYSENRNVYIFNYCRSCQKTFIEIYSTYGSSDDYHSYIQHDIDLSEKECIGVEPTSVEKHEFDEKICKLSPQFVNIYNQALAAETYKLDEIAGVGYRKAIEFLVKDYAIHMNESEKEKIENEPLGQCIRNYMADDIKILLERTSWIGNDETHYIRKLNDRDITDMKKFIEAAVYFIGMKLITEDAESICRDEGRKAKKPSAD